MIKQHIGTLSSIALARGPRTSCCRTTGGRSLASSSAGTLACCCSSSLIFILMVSLDAKQISKRYEPEDEAAAVILGVGILGAILTMASIVKYLSTARLGAPVA